MWLFTRGYPVFALCRYPGSSLCLKFWGHLPDPSCSAGHQHLVIPEGRSKLQGGPLLLQSFVHLKKRFVWIHFLSESIRIYPSSVAQITSYPTYIIHISGFVSQLKPHFAIDHLYETIETFRRNQKGHQHSFLDAPKRKSLDKEFINYKT